MHESFVKKYFFSIVLFVSLILGVILFWPFLTTILLGIVVSVLFFPLFQWLQKKIGNRSVASVLTVAAFIIILCIPLFFIATVVFNQAQNLYAWIAQEGALTGLMAEGNIILTRMFPGAAINLESSLAGVVSSFANNVGLLLSATLGSIFTLLLVLLSMFYFLKDGPHWKEAMLSMSPLSKGNDVQILDRLKHAINGIVKGYLLVGLAQGLLMGLGMFIFGVPHAALWGVFAAIASLVPTIGTALVAVPAIIFLFAMGSTGAALGMTAWSVLLVGLVDNLLNPYIVGKSINIHPLLILFGVLGGVALMGPVGILVGPLILSFIYALLSVSKSEVVV
ncbi:MAG TPA: AI-2E family transporter [Candidatus Paceibacterota bacterium]